MNNLFMNYQNQIVKKVNTVFGKLDKPFARDKYEQNHPWLLFLLDNIMYAIDAGYALRVTIMHELIPFVDAPVFCPGIIWGHDGMIRLFDLRVLLGKGDYRSAVISENDNLPVIIIIELDGRQCGVIVDDVVAVKYCNALIEDVSLENCECSPYIKGVIKDRQFVGHVPVIDPDKFISLEFEPQNTKIDWNARIDTKLLAEKIRKNGL